MRNLLYISDRNYVLNLGCPQLVKERSYSSLPSHSWGQEEKPNVSFLTQNIVIVPLLFCTVLLWS